MELYLYINFNSINRGVLIMNRIDKDFYNLTNKIKNESLEEISLNIKNKYLKVQNDIQNAIEDYFNKFPYWGKIKKSEGIYEELYNRSKVLKEHCEDLIWLYEQLGDYRSKKVLLAIVSNWYLFDFESLKTSYEQNYMQYFDLDLINCDKDEVIVDLGAYTGDTILDYLNCYGTDCYKKIYCYEITDESFEIMKNNLSKFLNIIFRKNAVVDENKDLYFNISKVDNSANMIEEKGDIKIEGVSLDNDIDDKITMIKMDIEGCEKKALIGAKNHIINDTPKLLISVYHGHDDLWKIPKLIKDINKNYNFYLRYYGNHIFPTEIVLIAIPISK